MDELEDFIKNNRKELDKYTPPPASWNRIKNALRKEKFPFIWLSAAAMIVVILGTAVMFYIWEYKDRSLFSNREINAILQKTDPHLKETEIYYNNLVNNLYKEATPLLTNYPDIEKELFKDFSEIDRICAEIKNDLKDNVDNQEVIEALINNYRIKIRLLEDMLNILKQNENDPEKNNKHAL